MTISGVILSGGKSSRFGSNKAFIEIDGRRIIDIALAAHKSLFGEVLVVTNDPDAYSGIDARVVTDIYKNIGTLGGIYAGLFHATGDAVFVTACDMPYLVPDLIAKMASMFNVDDVDVVVPRINGFFEPLFAVYGKACLPHMEASITAGIRQVFQFFRHVRVAEVHEPLVRSVDPELRSLVNINTREDLARVRTKG